MAKLLNRIIYIADLYKILEVISFPREMENPPFKVDDPQYDKFQIIEFVGEVESDAFKVGDLVPLEFRHCRHLKQIGAFPQYERGERVNFNEIQNYNQLMFQNFVDKFDVSRIKRLRDHLNDLSNDDEVSYRCFYNSFKMYRLRDYVIEMAEIMLSVAKQEDVKYETVLELVEDFKAYKFDDVLERSLIEILGTNFSMSRNESKAWFEDSQKLFASYFLFMKGADYLLKFCEKLIDKTNIVQDEKRRILDWSEAGAMTVWAGIGFLRTAPAESMAERFKNLKI